jgi:hypothetical protein
MACVRCGNKKHKIGLESPFPLCDECVICPECDGSRRDLNACNRAICEVCRGLGWVLKRDLIPEYEPSGEERLPLPEES